MHLQLGHGDGNAGEEDISVENDALEREVDLAEEDGDRRDGPEQSQELEVECNTLDIAIISGDRSSSLRRTHVDENGESGGDFSNRDASDDDGALHSEDRLGRLERNDELRQERRDLSLVGAGGL